MEHVGLVLIIFKKGAMQMSLGERLQKLSHSKQAPPHSPLESRLGSLECRLTHCGQLYNKKLSNLRSILSKLTKNLEQDTRTAALQTETRLRELEALDARINRKLQHEVTQRKQGEGRVLQLLEKRVTDLRAQVQKQGEAREHALAALREGLEDDLPALLQGIKREGVERENADGDNLQQGLGQIRALQEVVSAQRKIRQDSQNNMLELIKQLVAKVKKQIQDERKQRQSSHDTILGLVEEACNKITFNS